MKKVLLAAAFVLSFSAASAFAEEWTGVISDSKCGAKHGTDMNAKCVAACVKGGAAPVFVVGDKVYKLADPAKAMDHLGHKVTITGTMADDTVTIEDIKM